MLPALLILVLASPAARAQEPAPAPGRAAGGGTEVSVEAGELDGATGTEGRVATILGSPQTEAARLQQLVALGSGAVPEVLDAVAARVDRDPRPGDLPLLLTALARMDRGAVLGAMKAASVRPAVEQRLAVMAVAELLGGREALAVAAAATGSVEPDGDPEPRVIDAFERTALAALRGTPSLTTELPWMVREASLETSGALVRATAELGGDEALRSLVQLLGRRPELDATILSHLGRASRELLPPVSSELVPALRSAVSSSDPLVARAALQAVGQLEVTEALENCIELVESPDPTIAQASLRALEGITRLKLPGSEARWHLWLQEEQTWLDSEAEGVFSRLRASAPAQQRRAAELVLQHRLDRHRLASELTELLSSDHVDVRLLGIEALGRIDSRAALPALVAALSDDEARVAEQALALLQRLTRRDLPADAPEWLELLGRG